MKTKSKMVWGTHVPFMAIAIAMAVMALTYAPVSPVEAAGNSGCEGDEKVEGNYAVIRAPFDCQIDYVCIKAGRNILTFYPGDTGDGCYTLKWYGPCNNIVKVSGGGTSRDCKEISHVAATFKRGRCIW